MWHGAGSGVQPDGAHHLVERSTSKPVLVTGFAKGCGDAGLGSLDTEVGGEGNEGFLED